VYMARRHRFLRLYHFVGRRLWLLAAGTVNRGVRKWKELGVAHQSVHWSHKRRSLPECIPKVL
jgi:hypothetical protein